MRGFGVFPIGGPDCEGSVAERRVAGVAELGAGDLCEGVESGGVAVSILRMGGAGERRHEAEREKEGEQPVHPCGKMQIAGQRGFPFHWNGIQIAGGKTPPCPTNRRRFC